MSKSHRLVGLRKSINLHLVLVVFQKAADVPSLLARRCSNLASTLQCQSS